MNWLGQEEAALTAIRRAPFNVRFCIYAEARERARQSVQWWIRADQRTRVLYLRAIRQDVALLWGVRP